MNYAAYARVSTTEQIKGYSIEAQLDACHAYGEGQGWTLHRDYIDPGHSGRSDKRPGFQAFMRDAKNSHFQVVLVHKFDRFARNRAISATYKELLKTNGVRVVSVTEPIDDSPSSIILEGMLEVVAEWYSANLAQETRKGMLKKAQNGEWPTAPPLGYIKQNGWVELTEDAEKLCYAFREFSTNLYTLGEWVKVAYDMGYRGRHGGMISRGEWSRIFHNRFYIGVIKWAGIEVQGKHETLIDQETFDRVQEILAAHDGYKTRKIRRPYILTGFLWSLDTGSRMNGSVGKGIKYYRSALPDSQGIKHYVQAEIIESQVAGVLGTVRLSNITSLLTEGDIIDEALLLALKVTPTVGDLYHWLQTDAQRQALCSLAIEKYGLKVSGGRIVNVQPRPPFECSTKDECPLGNSNYLLYLGVKP